MSKPPVHADSPFTFVTSGSRGWAQYYSDRGAPFIRIGDLSRGTLRVDWQNAQRVQPPSNAEGRRTRAQPGDVLISITADLGVIGVVPEGVPEVFINQHIALARPRAGLDSRYLGWFLDSDAGGQRQLRIARRGATKAGLGLDDIRGLQVPAPELPIQRRVVAAIDQQFSRLDAAIASLTRAKVNVANARASVLKAAVEGRLVTTEAALSRALGHAYESGRELLARLRLNRGAVAKRRGAVMPSADSDVEHSPGITLPEGWAVAAVGEVADVQLGRQRSPKDHSGAHMAPYLRAANITWSGLDLTDVNSMNFAPDERPRFRLAVGDVLLNEASGSKSEVGKPAVWRGELAECYFQNTILRARTTSELRAWLHLHILADARGGRFVRASKGVGIHHLSAAGLAAHRIAVPPPAEQLRIVAEVDRRLGVLEAVEQAIDASRVRCRRLRQAILKHAFDGRLLRTAPRDTVSAPRPAASARSAP